MSPVDFATVEHRRRQRIDLGRQRRPGLRRPMARRAAPRSRPRRCSSRHVRSVQPERRAPSLLLVEQRGGAGLRRFAARLPDRADGHARVHADRTLADRRQGARYQRHPEPGRRAGVALHLRHPRGIRRRLPSAHAQRHRARRLPVRAPDAQGLVVGTTIATPPTGVRHSPTTTARTWSCRPGCSGTRRPTPFSSRRRPCSFSEVLASGPRSRRHHASECGRGDAPGADHAHTRPPCARCDARRARRARDDRTAQHSRSTVAYRCHLARRGGWEGDDPSGKRHSDSTLRMRTGSRSFHIPRITSTDTPATAVKTGPQPAPRLPSAPLDVDDILERGETDELEGRRQIAMSRYRAAIAGIRIVSTAQGGRTARRVARVGRCGTRRRSTTRSSGSSERLPATRRTSRCEYYLGVALLAPATTARSRRLPRILPALPHDERCRLAGARACVGSSRKHRKQRSANRSRLAIADAARATVPRALEVALLRRQGHREEARELARQARALDPTSSLIRYELTRLDEPDPWALDTPGCRRQPRARPRRSVSRHRRSMTMRWLCSIVSTRRCRLRARDLAPCAGTNRRWSRTTAATSARNRRGSVGRSSSRAGRFRPRMCFRAGDRRTRC